MATFVGGISDCRWSTLILPNQRWTKGWRGPISCRRAGGEEVGPDGGFGATCFGSVPEPERMALNAFLTAARSSIEAPPGESYNRDAARVDRPAGP